MNAKALSAEGGKYLYQGILFTGVAYTVSDCFITSAMEYRNGERVGRYSNEYLPNTVNQPKIYFEYLEPYDDIEPEPVSYQGEMFSGVGYDFEGDVFAAETYYKSGMIEAEVSYFRTGVIEAVELFSKDFCQEYFWHENSQIKEFRLFERDSFEIALRFKNTGKLCSLSIDEGYFERIKLLANKVRFNLFDKKRSGEALEIAESLFVSGSAVDDEVFSYLCENDGLRQTSKLNIFDSALTTISLSRLIPYSNVSQVTINSEIITQEEATNFKTQRPDCYVEFDRKEVIV